jgi:hypothetical protein
LQACPLPRRARWALCMSAMSREVAARERRRPSCTGSIPCWAISRLAWRARTTRLITPGMGHAIWPSSVTASTAGLTYPPCCPGFCRRW